MTDFWPEGITLEDAQSPKDILVAADEQWRTKSNGVLSLVIQETTSTKGHLMLAVHARHEPTNRTVNLFTVVHRPTAPYPVTIQPREDQLPTFLRKSYYIEGLPPSTIDQFVTGITKGRTVENEWVAETPSEFRDRLRDAFNLGAVKTNILALVSAGGDSTNGEGESTETGGESAEAER